MILFVLLFVMDGASVTDTIEVVEDSLVDTRFEIMNDVKVGFGFNAFGRAICLDSFASIGDVLEFSFSKVVPLL